MIILLHESTGKRLEMRRSWGQALIVKTLSIEKLFVFVEVKKSLKIQVEFFLRRTRSQCLNFPLKLEGSGRGKMPRTIFLVFFSSTQMSLHNRVFLVHEVNEKSSVSYRGTRQPR